MSPGGRRTLGFVLLALLVVLAPLGGGGSEASELLVLQTLALLAAIAGASLPAPGARPRAITLAAVLLLWLGVGLLRADYRFAAFTATLDVALGASVLWSAWRLGLGARLAPRLASIVVLAALPQAALALYQHAQSGGLRGTGTFTNPNHLAAFLNLALALVAARLVARRGRDAAAWGAAAVLLAAQWRAVASQGALAGLLIVFGWVALRAALRRRAARGWAVAIAVVLVAGASAGIGARFAGPEDVYRFARLEIWRGTLGAASQHPIAGIGPGMLEHVAERYNFPRFDGPVRFGRSFGAAHSQALEILVEWGIVGLLLVAVIGGSLAWEIARAREASAMAEVRTGVLWGLGALSVHALVETVFASPAVVLAAAVLAGAAVSPVPRARPARLAPHASGVRFAAATLIAAGWAGAVVAPWAASCAYDRLLRADRPETFRRELALALRFNPYQPYYYYAAARAWLRADRPLDAPTYSICYDYASKAAVLNPTDPHLHLLLAEISRRGYMEVFGDVYSREEAVGHFRRAVAISPTDPRPAAALAGFLLDLRDPSAALTAAAAALAIEPAFTRAARIRIEALHRLGREVEAAAAASALEACLEETRDYVPQNDYERVILERPLRRGEDGAGRR
jgi:O-antigen ligase